MTINQRLSAGLAGLLCAAFLAAIAPLPVSAADRPCGLEYVAGDWVFFTGVGRQMLVPEEGDPTALGTFNITADGKLKTLSEQDLIWQYALKRFASQDLPGRVVWGGIEQFRAPIQPD